MTLLLAVFAWPLILTAAVLLVVLVTAVVDYATGWGARVVDDARRNLDTRGQQ